jgi:2-dehydropantoate 2-reductase
MKIAVVGCGAVGSFYGGGLARAGHETHFLLRSDYEVVRRDGLRILSPLGDFQVRPACARRPEEIGPSDLVLIGLKTTANDQLPSLLPPLIGPHTAVVTLQNGLGNEEAIARFCPAEQILGGLCFVCLNRIQPGLIRHIDHGLVVIGEFQRPAQARTHEIAAAFRQIGVRCKVADDLACTHWEKLTWNVPFNGLGVAGAAGLDAVLRGEFFDRTARSKPPALLPCLTTDQLLAEPQWTALVRELIAEVVRSAQALGYPLSDSLADLQIKRTTSMGPYRASTLLDFERGLPLELESLFLEPLRQARRAGVPVPRLAALCRVLTQLDAERQRNAAAEHSALPKTLPGSNAS